MKGEVICAAMGIAIGLLTGLSMSVVHELAEHAECRKQHNVYKCEVQYVPKEIEDNG